MSETDRRSGGCLCAAVRYTTEITGGALHCHCGNCRRLTGNFIAAVRCAPNSLRIDDPDGRLGRHELGFAHYGFCTACGSTLYFEAADRPDTPSVTLGTIDDASGIELDSVWFAHEAQAHNVLPPDVPHHAGNA